MEGRHCSEPILSYWTTRHAPDFTNPAKRARTVSVFACCAGNASRLRELGDISRIFSDFCNKRSRILKKLDERWMLPDREATGT